jgi:vacuolar-type H+-ATPase subunit I/STV1
MCKERKSTKSDLIKELENINEVETDLILEARKKSKDINDFLTQVAVIKVNFKNLKEQFEKEVEERKKEIDKIIMDYTMRLNQIDTDLSNLYSKFHGFETIVYKEFKETKDDIFELSKEINNLKTELQTKFTKGVNKLLIAIITSGILIVISYFIGKYLEEVFK